MKIDIKLSEKDNIEVKQMYGKTVILLGDIEIEIEDKATAEYLLECLENTLVEEDKQRSSLGNKIEGLEEKIADLENELGELSNGGGLE